MSFFRYPGGKHKIKDKIVEKLIYLSKNNVEYREPFFGGGSIGVSLFDKFNKIWINDFDKGISYLWTTVIKRPDLLKNKVKKFSPSVEAFDKFKKELTGFIKETQSDAKICNYGFKKLAIHQISYSGLGVKSGGPLGGRDQKSKYKINCRYSQNYICEKIDKLHKKFLELNIRENCCTNYDFSKLILDDSSKALIYLDPPYYDKGSDLYQHGFNLQDHERLEKLLKNTKHDWLLSYDDQPEIRKMYSWANIQEVVVNYSITSLKDKSTGARLSRSKPELLIFKKD